MRGARAAADDRVRDGQAGGRRGTRRLGQGDARAALPTRPAPAARGAAIAFPRYDADVHAELAREALYGDLGDLPDSVHGMAVLFALDRPAPRTSCALRAAARPRTARSLRRVERGLRRGALREDVDGPFVDWVRGLEIDRFGVPVPDPTCSSGCR